MHGRTGSTALTVVRDKREVNLSISMPGRNHRSSLLPSGWPPGALSQLHSAPDQLLADRM
jgi:hypothetical protein